MQKIILDLEKMRRYTSFGRKGKKTQKQPTQEERRILLIIENFVQNPECHVGSNAIYDALHELASYQPVSEELKESIRKVFDSSSNLCVSNDAKIIRLALQSFM